MSVLAASQYTYLESVVGEVKRDLEAASQRLHQSQIYADLKALESASSPAHSNNRELADHLAAQRALASREVAQQHSHYTHIGSADDDERAAASFRLDLNIRVPVGDTDTDSVSEASGPTSWNGRPRPPTADRRHVAGRHVEIVRALSPVSVISSDFEPNADAESTTSFHTARQTITSGTSRHETSSITSDTRRQLGALGESDADEFFTLSDADSTATPLSDADDQGEDTLLDDAIQKLAQADGSIRHTGESTDRVAALRDTAASDMQLSSDDDLEPPEIDPRLAVTRADILEARRAQLRNGLVVLREAGTDCDTVNKTGGIDETAGAVAARVHASSPISDDEESLRAIDREIARKLQEAESSNKSDAGSDTGADADDDELHENEHDNEDEDTEREDEDDFGSSSDSDSGSEYVLNGVQTQRSLRSPTQLDESDGPAGADASVPIDDLLYQVDSINDHLTAYGVFRNPGVLAFSSANGFNAVDKQTVKRKPKTLGIAVHRALIARRPAMSSISECEDECDSDFTESSVLHDENEHEHEYDEEEEEEEEQPDVVDVDELPVHKLLVCAMPLADKPLPPPPADGVEVDEGMTDGESDVENRSISEQDASRQSEDENREESGSVTEYENEEIIEQERRKQQLEDADAEEEEENEYANAETIDQLHTQEEEEEEEEAEENEYANAETIEQIQAQEEEEEEEEEEAEDNEYANAETISGLKQDNTDFETDANDDELEVQQEEIVEGEEEEEEEQVEDGELEQEENDYDEQEEHEEQEEEQQEEMQYDESEGQLDEHEDEHVIEEALDSTEEAAEHVAQIEQHAECEDEDAPATPKRFVPSYESFIPVSNHNNNIENANLGKPLPPPPITSDLSMDDDSDSNTLVDERSVADDEEDNDSEPPPPVAPDYPDWQTQVRQPGNSLWQSASPSFIEAVYANAPVTRSPVRLISVPLKNMRETETEMQSMMAAAQPYNSGKRKVAKRNAENVHAHSAGELRATATRSRSTEQLHYADSNDLKRVLSTPSLATQKHETRLLETDLDSEEALQRFSFTETNLDALLVASRAHSVQPINELHNDTQHLNTSDTAIAEGSVCSEAFPLEVVVCATQTPLSNALSDELPQTCASGNDEFDCFDVLHAGSIAPLSRSRSQSNESLLFEMQPFGDGDLRCLHALVGKKLNSVKRLLSEADQLGRHGRVLAACLADLTSTAPTDSEAFVNLLLSQHAALKDVLVGHLDSLCITPHVDSDDSTPTHARCDLLCTAALDRLTTDPALIAGSSKLARIGSNLYGNGVLLFVLLGFPAAQRLASPSALAANCTLNHVFVIYLSARHVKTYLTRSLGRQLDVLVDLCSLHDADTQYVCATLLLDLLPKDTAGTPSWHAAVRWRTVDACIRRATGANRKRHSVSANLLPTLKAPEPEQHLEEEDEDELREAFVRDVQRILREYRVSLRHSFPDVHAKLTDFAASGHPFASTSIRFTSSDENNCEYECTISCDALPQVRKLQVRLARRTYRPTSLDNAAPEMQLDDSHKTLKATDL